jgi:hypothetical protein
MFEGIFREQGVPQGSFNLYGQFVVIGLGHGATHATRAVYVWMCFIFYISHFRVSAEKVDCISRRRTTALL